jgi:hypothetical protein
VGEDIANECRNGGDRCRAKDAVSRAIHLQEEGNGNGRADNAANRRQACVLETERGQHVAPSHDEETGKPGARELFGCRAHEATFAQVM